MIFGSVCSGVEAASVAWDALGWKPAWLCEFDKFPSAVLDYRFPNVPNLGDMLNIESKKEYNDRSIDVLIGGTPCQSFSIAGLRGGLDDERGNLALKFCKILRDKQPKWFIWENVPGVLSSNDGRDFAAILSGFSECGYSCAYRILDAQYYGVPQRRRRIFVVGTLRDWRSCAAVLFEKEGLRGDIAPCRRKGQSLTKTAGGKVKGDSSTEKVNHTYGVQGNIINRKHSQMPNGIGVSSEQSGTLTASDQHAVAVVECFEADRRDGIRLHGDQTPTLQAFMGTGGGNVPCISLNSKQMGLDTYDDLASTILASTILASDYKEPQSVFTADDELQKTIRRLTPMECERLQGFPDNWTQIPWRGKAPEDCPDAPRYKAMGNSMAVPVMRWIGERIDQFEKAHA